MAESGNDDEKSREPRPATAASEPPRAEASIPPKTAATSRPPPARTDAPATPQTSSSQRPPSRSSSQRPPPLSADDIPLSGERDRFSLGMVVPVAIAALAANVIGGLLAPGWIGVATERIAARWVLWGTVTPLAASLLGMATTIALVMAAVANPRTSISTRIVATFGAGLVLTLVAAAFRATLDPTHLIVLFAGAFAVLVSAGVEALTPPVTRAVGVQLALLAFSALFRVLGWGVAWWAGTKNHPAILPWSQIAASGAAILELGAQGFLALYLVYRPGWRGAASVVVAIGLALFLSIWTLRSDFDPNTAGGMRDAFQRAISLRIQGSGPMPSWVARDASMQEIAFLDHALRTPLLPLVFAEIASVTLAMAALVDAIGKTLPVAALYAAMALATMSRGQVDAPMRALELAVAALGALVLSRDARVRYATTARQSERPPPK